MSKEKFVSEIEISVELTVVAWARGRNSKENGISFESSELAKKRKKAKRKTVA